MFSVFQYFFSSRYLCSSTFFTYFLTYHTRCVFGLLFWARQWINYVLALSIPAKALVDAAHLFGCFNTVNYGTITVSIKVCS